jgi:hypothetical protein
MYLEEKIELSNFVFKIWRTWAPPRYKFFIWLASLKRYWTADCLPPPPEGGG